MKEFIKENCVFICISIVFLAIIISGTIIDLRDKETVKELVLKGIPVQEARKIVYGEKSK